MLSEGAGTRINKAWIDGQCWGFASFMAARLCHVHVEFAPAYCVAVTDLGAIRGNLAEFLGANRERGAHPSFKLAGTGSTPHFRPSDESECVVFY
jgi:hypothetical protein